jgi:ribonuclease P protein component
VRFRRADRLTRKAEFDFVLKTGAVRVTSGPFRAFAVASRDSEGPRLGLIVGRRQLRRAIDRNRIKRRVRESFRLCYATLPRIDVVIRLHRTPEADADLRVALVTLWQRLVTATHKPTHTSVLLGERDLGNQGDQGNQKGTT